MPVDLDNLLEEALGGEPTPNPEDPKPEDPKPEDPTPTDPANPDPVDENGQDPADEPAGEGGDEPKGDVDGDPKPNNKNKNPIKEVRDRLNQEQKARTKIENAIQRWSEGNYKCSLKQFKDENNKVDYDAFIKAMDEEDTKSRADKNNRTPELQAELDRIEKEKIELERSRLRANMDRSLADLQVSMSLTRADINTFFVDAMAKKKNPYAWLAQGGSLEDLYYVIYRDKIIEREVTKRAGTPPTPNPVPTPAPVPPNKNPGIPAGDPAKQEISLNDLLERAAGKPKK